MTFIHFLVWFALILTAGKLGGELAERIKLPAVLGELVAGVAVGIGGLGSLSHIFPQLASLEVNTSNQTLTMLGQLGAVLLLFEAGLDSDLKDLRRLGAASIWMASAGVIFSFLFCYTACKVAGLPNLTCTFLGGAMASTSVGISTRTFSDLRLSASMEAKTVLGAAVADDVMGLVILGVITGMVAVGSVSLTTVGLTALAAIIFLVVSLPAGLYLAPRLMRWASRMQTRAFVAVSGFALCLGLAIVAGKAAGLSPIIGAFVAGLVLSETDFKELLQQRLKPLADIFIPVFFVMMGAAMPITSVSPLTPNGRLTLGLAAALTFLAILAKAVGGMTVPFGKLNRLVVGCGMIPRGEVTLIFAAYGLKNGVIGGNMYSAILLVVLLTTFLTPPLLKIAVSLNRNNPLNGDGTTPNSEPYVSDGQVTLT